MAAARPSKASIQNVIEAMKACGMEPGDIVVDGKGGFTVKQKAPIDTGAGQDGKGPKRFGVAG